MSTGRVAAEVDRFRVFAGEQKDVVGVSDSDSSFEVFLYVVDVEAV